MQKKPLFVIIPLLLLSILIFFANGFAPFRLFEVSVQTVFSTPKSILSTAKADAVSVSSIDFEKIKKENERLTKLLVEYENVKRDNEALRSQFELANAPDYKLLPAKVIGFLGKFSHPASLIIDKGVLDDVYPDMAVIIENKLVGKIKKVSARYSEVALVTNSSFTGLARSAESNSPGIVTGAADFIIIDRVNVNDTLTVGEIVLTKGEINDRGYGLPPDLIIGKISSVNKSEALPFQSAKVESDVQFSKLNTLFIVLGL